MARAEDAAMNVTARTGNPIGEASIAAETSTLWAGNHTLMHSDGHTLAVSFEQDAPAFAIGGAYTVDVTHALKPGKNTLEILLTSTSNGQPASGPMLTLYTLNRKVFDK